MVVGMMAVVVVVVVEVVLLGRVNSYRWLLPKNMREEEEESDREGNKGWEIAVWMRTTKAAPARSDDGRNVCPVLLRLIIESSRLMTAILRPVSQSLQHWHRYPLLSMLTN